MQNNSVVPKIDIIGDKYASGITPEKLFVHLFNEPFNVQSCDIHLDMQVLIKELFLEYKLDEASYLYKFIESEKDNLKKIHYGESEFLFQIMEKVLFFLTPFGFKIYYGSSISQDKINKILDIVQKCPEANHHMGKFYMVTKSSGIGLDLSEYKISTEMVEISENYNDDFLEIHNLITTFLNTDKKQGLVLLHGKYGTGKTSYIRYLINTVNRRIVFLPLALIDEISSPDFLPFISGYKDSVLIIEDCEELLKPRELGNRKNDGIVNLLNLGDGLLADALSLKIICTFNADIKHIDQAILRKGRLVARYEFNDLEISKAQKLSDKLGFSNTINKSITLAELYNQDSLDFTLNKNKENIGFRH